MQFFINLGKAEDKIIFCCHLVKMVKTPEWLDSFSCTDWYLQDLANALTKGQFTMTDHYLS